MFFSWYRRCRSRSAAPQRRGADSTRSRSPGFRYWQLYAERLEERVAPAATLSFPSPAVNAATCSIVNVPISIDALTDGVHVGLNALTLEISYPAGEFNLPSGNSLATADLSLGSIPLSATGGASAWNLNANSPSAGQLSVALSAVPGGGIAGNPGGGSLVVLNLPVLSTAALGNQIIQIVTSRGSVHSQLVGSSGSFTLSTVSPGVVASGLINVTAGSALPPTVQAHQSFTVSSLLTSNEAAPGILTGATSTCGMLSVATVNGSAANVGTAVTLPSGASLTVQEDGSFSYVPPLDMISDSFTFQAMDMSGILSSTGTVVVNITPTLRLVPVAGSGTTVTGSSVYGTPGDQFTEQVVLDNPNQAGTGGMVGFNLALIYTSGALSVTHVVLGPNIPADWNLAVNSMPGAVALGAFGTATPADVIAGPSPLVLATINFTISGLFPSVPLDISAFASTLGGSAPTSIGGVNGPFYLNPTPENFFIAGIDSTVVNPTFRQPPPPDGDVNTLYNQTITALAGTPPYTVSLSAGTLPPGLSLSASGILSGIPTTVGSYSFTAAFADSTGSMEAQAYTIVINPAVAISPLSLIHLDVGETFSQTFTAVGGSGTYIYSVTAGSLPDGVGLTRSGVLGGAATTAGTYSFTVTAVDTLGGLGSQSCTMTVGPASVISVLPLALPNGDLGVAYRQTLSAVGGTGPYAFTISSGHLPPGIVLSSGGVLSGVPAMTGAYPFTVAATSSSASGMEVYTISINPAVAIETATVANGDVGEKYSQSIHITGGSGSYAFGIKSGTVPPGVSLSSNGVLLGVPTTVGVFSFAVSASDTLGGTVSQIYSVTINPGVVITTVTLASWTTSQPGYNQTIQATGGTGPYLFSSSGTLPSGLTLSSGGVLSGTPIAFGSFVLTVTATDQFGGSTTQAYTVTINPALAFVSGSTGTLPSWTANASGYSQTLLVSGGTTPMTYAVNSALPPGLFLTNGGFITPWSVAYLSGTPVTAGTYTFVVTATDQVGASASAAYTLTVNPAITILTTSLPGWTTFKPGYKQTLNATGGSGALTFSLEGGGFPAGLTLSSAGLLSGTPSFSGTYVFTVLATDSIGAWAGQTYTVTIAPGALRLSTSLADWDVNLNNYSQSITASGGVVPYTFALVSGSLPPGLTLSSSGVLSGTPITIGSFSFNVAATDSTSATGGQAYTVAINHGLYFSTVSLPVGTVGTSYLQGIFTSGGTGPISFALSTSTGAGTLPPGLNLSGNGFISGTPTAAGTFSFVVIATDSLGSTTSISYTIQVVLAFTLSPSSLPGGYLGLVYSQTIRPIGGTSPFVFSETGALPPGLTLSSSGVLSGTPTATGNYSFTITATDSRGLNGSHSYTLPVSTSGPATLSFGNSGATAVPNGTISLPINISALTDGTTHRGLSATTIAITWSPNSGSIPDLEFVKSAITASLGNIPLSMGASYWTLTTSTPADGRLNINLSASPGHTITTNTFPSGGTLFTVNLPVSASAPTGTVTFSILTNSSGVHTNVAGGGTGTGSQLYTLSTVSTGINATAMATIIAGSLLHPIAPSNPVAFKMPGGTTLIQSAPGILAGSTDPNTPPEPVSVGTVNGSAANVGAALTLASGATLTVQPNGSFVYVPPASFAGTDSFTFQVINASGLLSNTGTVSISAIPSLSLLPVAGSGTTVSGSTVSGNPGGTFTEQVVLNNPNQNGGMTGFNLALDYNPGTLTITSLTPGPDIPSDWTVVPNTATGAIGLAAFGTGVGSDVVTGPSPIVLATIHFTINSVPAQNDGLELVPTNSVSATSVSGVSGAFALYPALAYAYVSGVDSTILIGGSFPALTITTTTLPNWTYNVPGYFQPITAAGGSGTDTFSITAGTLPQGITLSGSILSGTPTLAGTYSFTVTATDPLGDSGSQSYTVVINPGLTITTTFLPNGTLGGSYSHTINATGGTGSRTFAVSSGTLPTGLNLSTAGVVSGTPTAVGNSSFSVTATDSVGATASTSYTIAIVPGSPILGITSSLAGGAVGISYNQTINATGGTGADTFAVTSGTLPSGLTLSAAGVLSGTPTSPGSYSFIITVTDATGATDSQLYALTVDSPVAITTASLPDGEVGIGYLETLSASGGGGSYTFTTSGGALPPGLSLNSGGVLSGTPTLAGSFSFTVDATDGLGSSTSQDYTITIHAPVTFRPALATWTPALTVDQDISQTLSASGGMGSTTFSVAGSLPAGLTLSSSGVLSGTPAVMGSFSFTVTATDALGSTSSQTFSLQVFAPTVYVDSSFTGPAGSDPASDPGLGLSIGTTAFSSVAAALGNLGAGGTLVLFGGTNTGADITSSVPLASITVAINPKDSPGSSTVTIAGPVSNVASLNVAPASTLTLGGTSTVSGTVSVWGTLVVAGKLTAGGVQLTGSSSILTGSGTVLGPVVVEGSASDSKITGNLTITDAGGTAIDVQAGAANVTITGVTVSGSNIGLLIEPGNGNATTITSSTFIANMQGLEMLNGCVTATGNIIGGPGEQGNNNGVYVPAVNPFNSAVAVNPLLTLERNQIIGNTVGLNNASTMGLTALFNWWGSAAGPGSTNGAVGVNVNDYTPYALDATSAGPGATGMRFFNGTGADGNVYVTGTLGADNLTAMVDGSNANLIHVTAVSASATTSSYYTRKSAGNRLIIYSFGTNSATTHDTIQVTGSWDAEIHTGAGNNKITTLGTGNDVIFGGGNDNINLGNGDNVLVGGLSTGKSGAPTAPQWTVGKGANLIIAGEVDWALAPLAPSGRLDYATLRSMDDLWASGAGGAADAMSAAALCSVANTPGAILTGTARAVITSGSGKSWYILKGASNPSTAALDSDYVSGSTGNPSYRQAIQ
jgi:hypothetical protein